MKNACLYCLLSLMISSEARGQIDYKFDFGSGKVAPGYTLVRPGDVFDSVRGYGFEPGTTLQSLDRGGDALRGDFITSSKPFFFSVSLPEGNYDVRLLLGDLNGTSATTVRVECRRLMLENIRTKKGEVSSQDFTVHVRDSLIRDHKGRPASVVRLKPREVAYRHWDNLLTIEFTDSMPKVCALEIRSNKAASTIFLAGNSTVVDQDREPWAAWGQLFPRFFVPDKVVVANYAESGETMRAFRGERRMQKIWSLAKPGDYLFIEFAHNDQKAGSNHLDPFTTYKQTLKEWIAEARSRHVTPVLVTSMHRRNFDSSGHIINTLGDYPDAMRQAAKEENVVLIDLNAMSRKLYEAWGPEISIKAFVHYPANTFPNQPEALKDDTHFSPYGAYQLAACVISDIRRQAIPLARLIRKEVPAFDPANPFPYQNFYWPQSPGLRAVKPDGN